MIPWKPCGHSGISRMSAVNVPDGVVEVKKKTSKKIEFPFETKVERIIPGGKGLAFQEGRAVFIPCTAPGDRLSISSARDRGSYLEALSFRIIAPSPVRQEPGCPHFSQCGGCDLQHLNPEQQLESKKGILLDSLKRIGKITFPREQVILHPSPGWGYRNRIQIKVELDGGRPVWGFYRSGSHRVEPLSRCLIAAPALWGFIQLLGSHLVSTPSVARNLSGVELFLGDERSLLVDFQLSAGVEDLQEAALGLRDLAVPLLPPQSSACVWISSHERVQLQGPGFVHKTVGVNRYRVSHGVFFQVNELMLEPLRLAAIADAQGRTALDLFCGAGFFTLALARGFDRVVGVEANGAAVEDLKASLEINQIGNVRAHALDFSDFLTRAPANSDPVDFLLLDPPRTGLPAETIDQAASLQVPKVVYVSCDPATLARDLRIFLAHQYQIESLTVLDLFPQTHHLETVARLMI
jgi:23S rRNA (uracil1939-C5)-methyltransferase